MQEVDRATIVWNERLGEALAYSAGHQLEQPEGRSEKTPRRPSQVKALAKRRDVGNTALLQRYSPRLAARDGPPLKGGLSRFLGGRSPVKRRKETACRGSALLRRLWEESPQKRSCPDAILCTAIGYIHAA